MLSVVFSKASNCDVTKVINVTSIVATPIWEKCEVATHTPKNGT
jgi:hypothetical protein